MTESDTSITYLDDPLIPVTRTARRNLLVTSTVGALMSKAGMVPTKLSLLGISLSTPEQQAILLLIAALIISYFIISFSVYGLSDFLRWRERYQAYLEMIDSKQRSWTQDDQEAYEELSSNVPSISWLYKMSKPTAVARIVLEIVFPIIFGTYIASSIFVEIWDAI